MKRLHSTDWLLVTDYFESAPVDPKAIAGIAKDQGSSLPYLILALTGIGLFELFISRRLTVRALKLGLLVLCG